MEIKKLPIDELELAYYNPRKDLQPGDEEYENLRRSIEEFGYVSPIVANKTNNLIIGGHQRYKVLKDLGYKEIDVILVDLGEEQEKMLNLALNKIEGDWDIEKLEDLFNEFQEAGIDASLTGFNEDEIDKLIGNFSLEEAAGSDDSEEEDDQEIDKKISCPRCQHVDDKEAFKIE